MKNRPIISICVPTYNRAAWLENLVPDLNSALEEFADQIEICISDNASTDHTTHVLAQFYGVKMYKTQRQTSNLGAARNIASVASMAAGRWILLVGDDDRLDLKAIRELLQMLVECDKNEWIILNRLSGQLSSRSQHTHQSSGVLLSPTRSKLFAIAVGAKPISFMGTHLIPATVVKDLQTMANGEMLVWPHLGLLYKFLGQDGKIRLFARPIVIQSAGELALFWPAKEFVKIYFEILRAIIYARSKTEAASLFFWVMLFRQLYAPLGFGLLLSWKLREKKDFRKQVREVCEFPYNKMKVDWLPILPHKVYVFILSWIPVDLIRRVLPGRHISKIDELHAREVDLSSSLNGVSRKL